MARGRTLVRLGPFRVTGCRSQSSGVLQAAEWLLLRYSPRVAACAIYLHVVAVGAVLLSGFWSVMNESFDPRAAKHAFGRIGGSGTLGGLCGGILAERVAAWVSSSAVVLVLAALHMACAALLWRAFPPAGGAGRPAAAPVREITIPEAIHRYPFLLTLAGLVLTASAGTALLDFVFKAQAAGAMGRGAPLVRFFGLYYTATSLLVFLLQTFITRSLRPARRAGRLCERAAGEHRAGSLAAVFLPGFRALGGVSAFEVLLARIALPVGLRAVLHGGGAGG